MIIFNSQNLDLFIPSQDEEFALTICNLIINNITGNLNLKNIIDNNLIQISMLKIRKHPIIKIKIIEQINENLAEDPTLSTLSEGFTNSAENNGILDYKEDLAMSDINEDFREPTTQTKEIPKHEDENIEAYAKNFVEFENSNEGLIAFEQSGSSNFSFI